jgi:urea transporter
MQGMTWDNLHDFALVGGVLVVIGLIITFYRTAERPMIGAIISVSLIAFIFCAWLLALWFTR